MVIGFIPEGDPVFDPYSIGGVKKAGAFINQFVSVIDFWPFPEALTSRHSPFATLEV